jgi:hypothetical protein
MNPGLQPKLLTLLVRLACARIGAQWQMKHRQLTAS